jgi:hypothetical protein
MGNKFISLIRLTGWHPLIDLAKSLASALTQRLSPNDVSFLTVMLERQIEVLMEGLGARLRRQREEENWSILKRLVFRNLLFVNLRSIGYEAKFVASAVRRLTSS